MEVGRNFKDGMCRLDTVGRGGGEEQVKGSSYIFSQVKCGCEETFKVPLSLLMSPITAVGCL